MVFLGGLDAIVEKFKATNARVLFGAEKGCWPDRTLAAKYPPVSRGYPYLNSGGFMGYATDIYELLSSAEISDKEDDQLYYTKFYLDSKLREKHSIKLDHRSEIFQNLFDAIGNTTEKLIIISGILCYKRGKFTIFVEFKVFSRSKTRAEITQGEIVLPPMYHSILSLTTLK